MTIKLYCLTILHFESLAMKISASRYITSSIYKSWMPGCPGNKISYCGTKYTWASMQIASFMSPSWKIGGCILNADILPWQKRSIYCITISAQVFIWKTHFHCPHTKGFFISWSSNGTIFYLHQSCQQSIETY